MGFLSTLVGEKSIENSGNATAITGNHNIVKENVIKATSEGVFNPMSPGNFESIRSAPVLTRPTYFTGEQSQALIQLAREKKEQLAHTKKATKALRKIDDCDRKVHNDYYRKYAPKIASNELSKLRGTNTYAKHLHNLRPGYAQLGQSLDNAESKADQAIANIAQSLR